MLLKVVKLKFFNYVNIKQRRFAYCAILGIPFNLAPRLLKSAQSTSPPSLPYLHPLYNFTTLFYSNQLITA